MATFFKRAKPSWTNWDIRCVLLTKCRLKLRHKHRQIGRNHCRFQGWVFRFSHHFFLSVKDSAERRILSKKTWRSGSASSSFRVWETLAREMSRFLDEGRATFTRFWRHENHWLRRLLCPWSCSRFCLRIGSVFEWKMSDFTGHFLFIFSSVSSPFGSQFSCSKRLIAQFCWARSPACQLSVFSMRNVSCFVNNL